MNVECFTIIQIRKKLVDIGEIRMPKRKDENQELYYFANALRNFLDLDPIYQDGRTLIEDSNQIRYRSFYSHEYSVVNSSIRKTYQAI